MSCPAGALDATPVKTYRPWGILALEIPGNLWNKMVQVEFVFFVFLSNFVEDVDFLAGFGA